MEKLYEVTLHRTRRQLYLQLSSERYDLGQAEKTVLQHFPHLLRVHGDRILAIAEEHFLLICLSRFLT